MSDPTEIAKGLKPEQRAYMLTNGREGKPHGLVRRGLLAYKWGMDSNFGYKNTPPGLAVRRVLEGG